MLMIANAAFVAWLGNLRITESALPFESGREDKVRKRQNGKYCRKKRWQQNNRKDGTMNDRYDMNKDEETEEIDIREIEKNIRAQRIKKKKVDKNKNAYDDDQDGIGKPLPNHKSERRQGKEELRRFY